MVADVNYFHFHLVQVGHIDPQMIACSYRIQIIATLIFLELEALVQRVFPELSQCRSNKSPIRSADFFQSLSGGLRQA